MFDKKKEKNEVCFCCCCSHKTARECIEIRCSCCIWADRTRLEHPVVLDDDLSFEEKHRREEEVKDRDRKRRERRLK